MAQINDTAAGYQIGNSTDKVGLFGTTPVVQQTGGAATAATGAVADDDSAATNGTAVNVVPIGVGIFAGLESTTAGNADTTFEIGDGGPVVFVNDNDTPGGVQLYFDEDAAATDSRFLAVSPTGTDLFIMASTGEFVRVVHDASAASNGVAVYIDDDAANAYEKLLFVSPTDTAGAYTTDDTVGANATALNEIRAAVVAIGIADGS